MPQFRLLALDDSRMGLVPLLEKLRAAVPCIMRIAASPEDFSCSLAAFAPDLVVAAADGDALSGWELLPILRENTPALPCVLVTETLSPGDADRAAAAGAADLILKGRPGRLVSTVRRIVSEIESRKARLEMARRDIHLQRLQLLVRVSAEILSESSIDLLLGKISETAREVVGARYAMVAYGHREGAFRHAAVSHVDEVSPFPPDEEFSLRPGTVCAEILGSDVLLRLSNLDVQARCSRLPEWHPAVRGMLAAKLQGVGEEFRGVVMVTDKVDGSDFNEEDEALLAQVAAMASLAVKHLEAREALRQANETLERRVQARNAELVDVVSALQKEISERRKAEKALRKSEKRYRSIFMESMDVICILDADLRIVDLSPAARELFGVPRRQLLNHDMAELYGSEEDRESFRRQLLQHGYLRDFSAELKRPDGGRLHVIVSAAAIHEDDGTISGYWEIVRDITERTRLEQQLLQAQKMESIGVLAGGVAHDFNNLLTAISGYAQIIESVVEPGDEPIYSSLSHILTASERASELTRNLLAFSRKQVLNPRPISLNDIVRNTAGFLSRIIGEDIDFGLDLTEENLIVNADPGQIGQVLMNLAANARDAMPGGGRISLVTSTMSVHKGAAELHDLDPSGSYGVISFSDTGEGMDDRTKARIFEPFFTTKDIGKGTGLGLSIIYGIVRQHNGTVTVDSSPGSGTTFRVYLPLAETKSRPHGRRRIDAVVGGRETIAVAEDDPTVRLYIRSVLERAGYRVLTANNGGDAVDLINRHTGKVDLLITDVIMPKMTGREVYEAVAVRVPEMKVIYISGYTADVIHKNLLLDDRLNFIMKPVAAADLLLKVREVLDVPVS